MCPTISSKRSITGVMYVSARLNARIVCSNISWADDARERDDAVIAVRSPARLLHVHLGGKGRRSGARAAPLHVDDDARHLRHDRVSEILLLEAEARARRRRERLGPRERGADDGAHRGDLVLHLDELAADLRELADEVLGDLGGRA